MPKVTFGPNGMLRGVPYHDGYLDGVVVDGKSVYLGIRSIGGDRRVLALRQVIGFCVDGFLEGNVVLSIRVLPSAEARKDQMVREIIAEKLDRTVDVLPMDCLVFVLESSYGADVVGLCGQVEISEPGGALGVRSQSSRSASWLPVERTEPTENR